MAPFISCKQVVKAYKVAQHEIVALRGIDFEMEQGEQVAIIGPSGSGKSSLLNLLGGLDKPTAGQLLVNGENLLEMNQRQLADYRLNQVGFVWQQVDRNLLGHRSAIRNVTLPMMLAGIPVWQRGKRARELLEAVGLGDQLRKRPLQLSGGQQQRVSIAVALANEPPLLLADEPTGALDRVTGELVMELIKELRHRFGLTVLMTTHDLEIADYADRVLTLRDGALGQDMSGNTTEAKRNLDDMGRVQLPEAVREQLNGAANIAVEIRPEGILLRAEHEEDDDVSAMVQDMVPQDAPPEKQRGLLRRRHKNKAAKAAKKETA